MPASEQGVEPLQRAILARTDQLLTNLRVDRVQRHVERREVLLGDPVDVGVAEVRERDEVALEEGQAVVIVAQVERAAKPLRQLRHEAERAAVAAGAHAIEHGFGEGEAPRLPGRSRQLEPVGVTAVPDYRERRRLVVCEPLPVDDVSQGLAVDFRHDIAREEARTLCGTARGNGADGAPARDRRHVTPVVSPWGHGTTPSLRWLGSRPASARRAWMRQP